MRIIGTIGNVVHFTVEELTTVTGGDYTTVQQGVL